MKCLGNLIALFGFAFLTCSAHAADVPNSQMERCVNSKETSEVILKACSDVIAANSNQPKILLPALAYRGLAYIYQDNNDGAIQDFNQYLKLQPDDPGVLVNRARAFVGKGLNDRAIDDLNNALRLDPNNAPAYAGLITPYVAENNFKLAIENSNQAIQRIPNNAGLYYERGLAKIYNNEAQSAVDDLETAVRLEPTNAYKVIWLHLAHVQLGQDDVKEFETNSARFSNDKWPAPIISFYLNKLSAGEVFSAAKATDPTTQQQQVCEANFYVGVAYVQKNLKDQAKPVLTAASKDCPILFLERSLAEAQLKIIGQ